MTEEIKEALEDIFSGKEFEINDVSHSIGDFYKVEATFRTLDITLHVWADTGDSEVEGRPYMEWGVDEDCTYGSVDSDLPDYLVSEFLEELSVARDTLESYRQVEVWNRAYFNKVLVYTSNCEYTVGQTESNAFLFRGVASIMIHISGSTSRFMLSDINPVNETRSGEEL